MSELGRYVTDTHGAVLVFHTHADSHVGTQEEIERFLDGTDPETVQLCLDTGHVAYCGADNLKLIADYPDRVQYVHLKQVEPRSGPGSARRSWASRRPSASGPWSSRRSASPDMPSLLAALAGSTASCTASSSRTCTPVTSTSRSRSPYGPSSTSRACGLGAGRPLG